MPRKPADPPPPPSSRDTWVAEFAAELARLRPYLLTQGNVPNKAAHTTALVSYEPAVDPKVAAQRYHERNG